MINKLKSLLWVSPLILIIWVFYQRNKLSNIWHLELFSWTQVLTDTVSNIPLTILVLIYTFIIPILFIFFKSIKNTVYNWWHSFKILDKMIIFIIFLCNLLLLISLLSNWNILFYYIDPVILFILWAFTWYIISSNYKSSKKRILNWNKTNIDIRIALLNLTNIIFNFLNNDFSFNSQSVLLILILSLGIALIFLIVHLINDNELEDLLKLPWLKKSDVSLYIKLISPILALIILFWLRSNYDIYYGTSITIEWIKYDVLYFNDKFLITWSVFDEKDACRIEENSKAYFIQDIETLEFSASEKTNYSIVWLIDLLKNKDMKKESCKKGSNYP